MGRGIGLVLATLSAPSWWGAADAFVVPAPRTIGGGETTAVAFANKQAIPSRRWSSHRIVSTRHDAASTGVDQEEAEVVVIGSGIAG